MIDPNLTSLRTPLRAALAAACLHFAGAAVGQTSVPNTLDADSYIYFGTNSQFSPELTVGVDLTSEGIYHFNFGVIEFDDLGAFDTAGDKFLRFEAEAYAITQVIDGFPVTTLSPNGSADIKLVALDAPYSAYLAASDKAGWYDAHVGSKPALATASMVGLGAFDLDVTAAVNDWLTQAADNYGFAVVLTGGDPVELGANEGGNGGVLIDTPLVPRLPGDTNGDGDVDDSDLGTAFANYTGPVGAAGAKGSASGDTDGDGDVDDSDLGTALAAYTGPQSPAAVPEPGVMTLLGAGALVLLRRRRRA